MVDPFTTVRDELMSETFFLFKFVESVNLVFNGLVSVDHVFFNTEQDRVVH
jgi:hypothetical protein